MVGIFDLREVAAYKLVCIYINDYASRAMQATNPHPIFRNGQIFLRMLMQVLVSAIKYMSVRVKED